jgi:hypothetical protein
MVKVLPAVNVIVSFRAETANEFTASTRRSSRIARRPPLTSEIENNPVRHVMTGRLPQKTVFSPICETALALFARENGTMRTIAIIFVLALFTIAGGVYSDAVLTSGQIRSAAVPDPAAAAVAHVARSAASSPLKGG